MLEVDTREVSNSIEYIPFNNFRAILEKNIARQIKVLLKIHF